MVNLINTFIKLVIGEITRCFAWCSVLLSGSGRRRCFGSHAGSSATTDESPCSVLARATVAANLLGARCWCYSRKCPSICWINALDEQNIGGVIGQGLIIILTLFIMLLIELSNRPSIFLNTSLSLGLFAVPRT